MSHLPGNGFKMCQPWITKTKSYMKMPIGDLFDSSTYTHRACASALPAKCVALMKRTGQTNKNRTKEAENFPVVEPQF